MATILCLDDEPAIGLILQDTLERAGHQTVAAHNVPEALQALTGGTVDLTGTSPQTAGPTNVGPAMAPTGAFTIVKSFLDPGADVNSGAAKRTR